MYAYFINFVFLAIGVTFTHFIKLFGKLLR